MSDLVSQALTAVVFVWLWLGSTAIALGVPALIYLGVRAVVRWIRWERRDE